LRHRHTDRFVHAGLFYQETTEKPCGNLRVAIQSISGLLFSGPVLSWAAMQFLPLLGKRLKDDEVVDILESLDMVVIYEFDRLHEGQPDVYWTAARPAGFQFKFDEAQKLTTIFLYITPGEGFAAISFHDCDIPFFANSQEVESFGETRHLQVTKGSADFLGVTREWVRLGFASHSNHYEFRAGSLALVTVSRKDEITS
jgi:hypothetical protein